MLSKSGLAGHDLRKGERQGENELPFVREIGAKKTGTEIGACYRDTSRCLVRFVFCLFASLADYLISIFRLASAEK